MKRKGWLVSAFVVGGAVFGLRGGCANSTAPDEQLADHFEQLCGIAKDNVETPEKGVRRLGRYMGRHLDDILGDFGATIVTIEKIDDDAKHDARARVARDRMQKPWLACANDWQRFWSAVEESPEASRTVERAADRLGRTFDIIFSSRDFALRTFPAQLLERFDRASR